MLRLRPQRLLRVSARVSLVPYNGVSPRLHPTVFVADGARIVGDVEIGERSSVWFNAVVRGDIFPIRIGRRTNIQDGCVLHVKAGLPVTVGDEVTFGHGVMAHGCAIGDLCLLGPGSLDENRVYADSYAGYAENYLKRGE